MRKFKFILLISIIFFSCKEKTTVSPSIDSTHKELLSYVNPLMGTDSEFSLSNGNTYPAIATPWGMNF